MVLSNFDAYLPQFWQVIPPSEDNSVFTHEQAPVAKPVNVPSSASPRSPSQNRSRAAVTMKMQADARFQVQNTASSGTLDQNYWGKALN